MNDLIPIASVHLTKRPINEDRVVELMATLKALGVKKMAPILITRNGHWLRDGLHRLEAAKRLGWLTVRFQYGADNL